MGYKTLNGIGREHLGPGRRGALLSWRKQETRGVTSDLRSTLMTGSSSQSPAGVNISPTNKPIGPCWWLTVQLAGPLCAHHFSLLGLVSAINFNPENCQEETLLRAFLARRKCLWRHDYQSEQSLRGSILMPSCPNSQTDGCIPH